jgi:DNA-directed RNA polymerase subunit RPC12/RpoP
MGERNANIGPKYAVRIGDLRPYHKLTVACPMCGHRRQMRLWQLRAGQGPNTMLTSIEARLRCMRCGSRGFATVLVTVSEEG